MRNPLNDSDVNGNTLAWMSEQDHEKDLYLCRECYEMVTEDTYNHKQQCCYSCWFGGE